MPDEDFEKFQRRRGAFLSDLERFAAPAEESALRHSELAFSYAQSAHNAGVLLNTGGLASLPAIVELIDDRYMPPGAVWLFSIGGLFVLGLFIAGAAHTFGYFAAQRLGRAANTKRDLLGQMISGWYQTIHPAPDPYRLHSTSQLATSAALATKLSGDIRRARQSTWAGIVCGIGSYILFVCGVAAWAWWFLFVAQAL